MGLALQFSVDSLLNRKKALLECLKYVRIHILLRNNVQNVMVEAFECEWPNMAGKVDSLCSIRRIGICLVEKTWHLLRYYLFVLIYCNKLAIVVF